MSWESKLDWESAKKRAVVMHAIREFFLNKNVVEIETPLLSNGTITDPFIESFSCRYNSRLNQGVQKAPTLYLQSSPEFAMKRLLASGYQSIYQICKAFRDEEHGTFHNPEFSMLEWYRIDFNHYQLMAEVDELLQCVLATEEAERFSYKDVFQKFLGIDPLTADLILLKSTMAAQGIFGDWIEDEQDSDVLLQVLFSERIEKNLGMTRPCFIYNYPKTQASLAKISTQDERVAERFECFYQGIELANGFNELTDPIEQKKRFLKDNVKREVLGFSAKPIDENFIDALASGLPECAGVALGLDRLLMLKFNAINIEQVMTFNITNA